MKRRIQALFGVCALAAGVIACSSKSASPVAPAATEAIVAADLPPDGSTLKVDPAEVVAPINDLKLTSSVVVLAANGVTLQFVSPVALQYRFQVFNADGAMVENRDLQRSADQWPDDRPSDRRTLHPGSGLAVAVADRWPRLRCAGRVR